MKPAQKIGATRQLVLDATKIPNESTLTGLTLALIGDGPLNQLSSAETILAKHATSPDAALVRRIRLEIKEGLDPLGETFCALRSPEQRRPDGAVYTPAAIVDAMTTWGASLTPKATRVVDPGAGSGRFLTAAARALPKAKLVAVELDPLAALLTRANLSTLGHAERTTVIVDDYRAAKLTNNDGPTLYLGNPPYVRHHQIAADWKDWLGREAENLGHSASKLAGLHVHFFLATALLASKGDSGCFITSGEWLDVNYGSVVRQLLLDVLGGLSLHVLEPKAMPFADAATTGTITCFQLGAKPNTMKLRRVENARDLGNLDGGKPVRRERLAEAPRWSLLLRNTQVIPEDSIELGELCRVHRGTVTGANHIWVGGAENHLLPGTFLQPSITKARELFAAGSEIAHNTTLRRVVDLPADLDTLEMSDRKQVAAWIKWAKANGAADGYIARHRKAWWSIGMRSPAPILATYMARRPPTFVRNLADARHINIAHGLYPRQPLTIKVLNRLAESLRTTVTQAQGRTYAGGLTKFEPREMERILIPSLETLMSE